MFSTYPHSCSHYYQDARVHWEGVYRGCKWTCVPHSHSPSDRYPFLPALFTSSYSTQGSFNQGIISIATRDYDHNSMLFFRLFHLMPDSQDLIFLLGHVGGFPRLYQINLMDLPAPAQIGIQVVLEIYFLIAVENTPQLTDGDHVQLDGNTTIPIDFTLESESRLVINGTIFFDSTLFTIPSSLLPLSYEFISGTLTSRDSVVEVASRSILSVKGPRKLWNPTVIFICRSNYICKFLDWSLYWRNCSSNRRQLYPDSKYDLFCPLSRRDDRGRESCRIFEAGSELHGDPSCGTGCKWRQYLLVSHFSIVCSFLSPPSPSHHLRVPGTFAVVFYIGETCPQGGGDDGGDGVVATFFGKDWALWEVVVLAIGVFLLLVVIALVVIVASPLKHKIFIFRKRSTRWSFSHQPLSLFANPFDSYCEVRCFLRFVI